MIVNARVAVVGLLPALRAELARAQGSAEVTLGRRRVFLGDWVEVPVYGLDHLTPGQSLKGPAIFESATTTVLVREGERVEITPQGWLDISVG